MGPIRPWVSRIAGVTTAGLYLVRFLLSAMESALSSLHTERGGNLDVNEFVGVFDTSFGDSHVHFCAVSGLDGRVVHKDFDVCTEAGASRKVRNFISQSV